MASPLNVHSVKSAGFYSVFRKRRNFALFSFSLANTLTPHLAPVLVGKCWRMASRGVFQICPISLPRMPGYDGTWSHVNMCHTKFLGDANFPSPSLWRTPLLRIEVTSPLQCASERNWICQIQPTNLWTRRTHVIAHHKLSLTSDLTPKPTSYPPHPLMHSALSAPPRWNTTVKLTRNHEGPSWKSTVASHRKCNKLYPIFSDGLYCVNMCEDVMYDVPSGQLGLPFVSSARRWASFASWSRPSAHFFAFLAACFPALAVQFSSFLAR